MAELPEAPWANRPAQPELPDAPFQQEQPGFFSRLWRALNPTEEDIEAGLRANQQGGGFSPQAATSAVRNIFEGIPKAGSALWDWEREHIPGMKDYTSPALTNEQIEGPISTGLRIGGMDPQTIKDWTQHQPQNPAEQLGMGAIEMAPNLLGGGGAPLATKLLTRVAGPVAAMEGAGEVAGAIDPSLEPAARFVAGIVTGGRPTAPTAELANAVRLLNTTKGGIRAVADVLKRSGMDDAEISARLGQLGMDAPSNLMDVNPVAQQAGMQVYSKGGRGRTAMQQALLNREAGTSARVETDLRNTLGPRVNKDAHLNALKQRLSDLGDQQREAARTGQTHPADLQDIIDDIDTRLGTEKSPAVRSALEEVKKNLHIGKTQHNQPDALETASEPILSARQAIDERLYDANGKLRDSIGRKEKQALLDLRAKINEQLDVTNPELRAKDAEIEAAAKEKTAFDTGRKEVLRKGDEAISPEEFDVRWAKMSDAEKAQVRAGLTRKIDAMVGLKANDRVALKDAITGQGKWNHAKIARIIGQENADALLNSLEREATFQNTTNKVTQNSKTADTFTLDEGHPVTEGLKSVANKAAVGGALQGIHGAVVGGALGGVTRGLDWLGGKAVGRTRDELGRMLVANPQAVLDAVKKLRAAQDTGRGLATLGAAAASRDEERR